MLVLGLFLGYIAVKRGILSSICLHWAINSFVIFALVILLSDASRFMISEINPEMNLLLVMFYGDIFGILVWTLIYLLVRKLK